jgi:hypothetical protein
MATVPNYLPRAQRYAIPIAILYRSPGERQWLPGLTENISRSGVLFRAERSLEPDTQLELMLDLPSVIAPSAGKSLRRGRVVRAAQSHPEDRATVAATFIDFTQTPTGDPRRI